MCRQNDLLSIFSRVAVQIKRVPASAKPGLTSFAHRHRYSCQDPSPVACIVVPRSSNTPDNQNGPSQLSQGKQSAEKGQYALEGRAASSMLIGGPSSVNEGANPNRVYDRHVFRHRLDRIVSVGKSLVELGGVGEKSVGIMVL
jgi:hypothetical protein